MVIIHRKLTVLVGALLLSAAGCATAATLPLGSAQVSVTSARSVPTSAASTVPTLPAVVPLNQASMTVDNGSISLPPSPTAPANTPGCDGRDFQLLPASAATEPTADQWLRTTFVLRFNGASSCAAGPGIFGVSMTAADGTSLPIDAIPAGGGGWSPLPVHPRQLLMGALDWAVTQGNRHPTELTFYIGDTTAHPINVSVADVTIPPHPVNPDPTSPWRSTAYGQMTSAADPASLATLTVAISVADTVLVPATLSYTVTLANPTDVAVPLTGCPQFAEQLSVVPQKTPIIVGARGPLNCSHLPPALGANSSVTLQMQLHTAGEVPGPGQLTWQLLDHGKTATTATAFVTVHTK